MKDIRRQKLVLCLIISLVVLMMSSVESKHFCDRFIANKNQISYVFRRFFTPQTTPYTKHSLIINGSYWTIEFKDENDVKSLHFEDGQQITKRAPLFSDQYSAATCIWFGTEDSGRCVTALYKKNRTEEVVIAEIPSDDHRTERELSDYVLTRTLTVKELSNLRPVFALTSVYEWYNSKVLFIEKSDSNQYIAQRYIFSNDSANGLKATKDKELNDAIRKYSGPNLIFGLSPQHSFSANIEGFLVLLKDHENHHRLLWCWVPFNAADCKPEELVDCSNHESAHWSSQTLSIIMFLVIIGFLTVLVVCMIGVVYFILGRADKVDAPDAKSDPNVRTKDSSQTQ